MSRAHTLLFGLLVFARVLLSSEAAYADDPAAAESLFQEGRRLLNDGQVSVACEKFKESFALDAMSGTLLNLAACYEKDGRTATAWARFRNAASLAKSQGKTEQAAEANRRIKALEAELSYMTIVAPEPVPGMEVKRNDAEVSPASFGVAVPVDPGHVEVVASAPGFSTIRLSAEVGVHHDKQTITIPKLAPDRNAAADQALTDKPVADSAANAGPVMVNADAPVVREKRTKPKASAADEAPVQFTKPEIVKEGPGLTPWIIGGLGVAAAATGGVFGVMAMRSNDDANNQCPSRVGCSMSALNAADRRDQQAMIASIGVGVGLAGIVTAAVWLLVDRPKQYDDDTGLVLRPMVARDNAGLWAGGKF